MTLQAVSMLLQGVSLGVKVCSIGLVLVAGDSQALNLTADLEEFVFLLFKAQFGVSELN